MRQSVGQSDRLADGQSDSLEVASRAVSQTVVGSVFSSIHSQKPRLWFSRRILVTMLMLHIDAIEVLSCNLYQQLISGA